jgi:hypothetical protein
MSAAKVELERNGDEITLRIKLTLGPGTPMLDCEEQIRAALDEGGRAATAECLRNFDSDGSPITLGGVKLTSKGKVPKDYQCPYGVVGVPRHVYQSSEGGQTFCPLDQQARILDSTTPRFARMCSFKYAAMSSTLAAMDLRLNHGREVSRCYLQDISEAAGLIAQDKEERWQYADPEPAADVRTVAVGVDGACMFYCQEGWRQAMVGTISLYDRLGERLHTVYLAAPPEYGKEQFYRRMEQEIARYQKRYDRAEWVGVADGAHDQWDWLKPFVDRLVLDFWHAAGYLEGAAAAVCPARALRQDWFEENRRRLKEEDGAATDLLAEMKKTLQRRAPGGQPRRRLEAAISYFEHHLEKMDYSSYLRAHLPIGSGVTEAACKTIVKQRMCGSGMKWKETGAAAVLRLRALLLSDGRWEQFWSKISRFGF